MEAAWAAVFGALRRLEGSPASPIVLKPLEQLVSKIKACERVSWLVEIEENFRDQLDRGLDSIERGRRAELWFVKVLLCLAEVPPNRRKARQLVAEMRERGYCPFGIAGIAGNFHEYLLHHLSAREQQRRQKREEMLTQSVVAIAGLVKRKSMIRRNLTFASWTDDLHLTPSEIRERWNAESLTPPIPRSKKGIELIKKGILAARRVLKELANRQFPLTAAEALSRLPNANGD